MNDDSFSDVLMRNTEIFLRRKIWEAEKVFICCQFNLITEILKRNIWEAWNLKFFIFPSV